LAVQDRFKAFVEEMFEKGIRFEDARLELERLYIERALATSAGSLSRAAGLLGVHRNTLTRKLSEQRRAAAKYNRSR
jgi:DNA-binding NtrC family response regulator